MYSLPLVADIWRCCHNNISVWFLWKQTDKRTNLPTNERFTSKFAVVLIVIVYVDITSSWLQLCSRVWYTVPVACGQRLSFLSAFAKLRKVTISFVLFVRLSVGMQQLGSHWTDFHEIWYLRIFRKSVEKIQVSLKSNKNKGYFTWRPVYIVYDISLGSFLRMRNISDKSCRENQNTHFVFSNFF
jgi:hypothetical protein